MNIMKQKGLTTFVTALAGSFFVLLAMMLWNAAQPATQQTALFNPPIAQAHADVSPSDIRLSQVPTDTNIVDTGMFIDTVFSVEAIAFVGGDAGGSVALGDQLIASVVVTTEGSATSAPFTSGDVLGIWSGTATAPTAPMEFFDLYEAYRNQGELIAADSGNAQITFSGETTLGADKAYVFDIFFGYSRSGDALFSSWASDVYGLLVSPPYTLDGRTGLSITAPEDFWLNCEAQPIAAGATSADAPIISPTLQISKPADTENLTYTMTVIDHEGRPLASAGDGTGVPLDEVMDEYTLEPPFDGPITYTVEANLFVTDPDIYASGGEPVETVTDTFSVDLIPAELCQQVLEDYRLRLSVNPDALQVGGTAELSATLENIANTPATPVEGASIDFEVSNADLGAAPFGQIWAPLEPPAAETDGTDADATTGVTGTATSTLKALLPVQSGAVSVTATFNDPATGEQVVLSALTQPEAAATVSVSGPGTFGFGIVTNRIASVLGVFTFDFSTLPDAIAQTIESVPEGSIVIAGYDLNPMFPNSAPATFSGNENMFVPSSDAPIAEWAALPLFWNYSVTAPDGDALVGTTPATYSVTIDLNAVPENTLNSVLSAAPTLLPDDKGDTADTFYSTVYSYTEGMTGTWELITSKCSNPANCSSSSENNIISLGLDYVPTNELGSVAQTLPTLYLPLVEGKATGTTTATVTLK